MRIITANLNGIRAAARRGFFTWLAQQNADVVCLQETKAQRAQLIDPIFYPEGYHCYYHDAQKKGYSGVALYSKIAPKSVQIGIGWEDVDAEGRFLEAQFEQFSVVSLYLHSGSSSEQRQALKFDFMARFLPYLQQRQENLILCGDWNIAHKPIDLANWKANQKSSGFLPEERAWMEELLTTGGFADAFRVVNQSPEQYTWWSNFGRAWEKNVGWRIDYHIISQVLQDKVQYATIYKEQRFSDHSPVIIDYDMTLA